MLLDVLGHIRDRRALEAYEADLETLEWSQLELGILQ